MVRMFDYKMTIYLSDRPRVNNAYEMTRTVNCVLSVYKLYKIYSCLIN